MPSSPWENPAFALESLARIDQKFLPATEDQVCWLMKKMGLKESDALLDLGCGTGRHAIAFAHRYLRVIGIDISETMLQYAKQRAEDEGVVIEFVQADLAQLSYLRLPKFHGAICLCESGIGVLGGEQADLAFFESVYDLLYPGAYFVLTCLNALRRYLFSKDQNPQFDYLSGTLDWNIEMNGTRLREQQRQYTPSEMKMLLTQSGFEAVEVLSCDQGVFTDLPMGIEDIEMLVCARRSL